ncbi:poly(ADP-ribose) glycohydrolase-like [Salvelinus fontinalis]|uniref:poly(ADP-ribose) glycohydrolase-like n=1 Tax=Salvelinus fontinalis TaxID=8038 RepID=UPI0024858EE3|nr:poly(ADP-ribose) glycohydrolase-like [Salvelinus fontinalis]
MALLQMLAAAEAGRDVAYFTYGDSDLMTRLPHHALLPHTETSQRRDVFGLLGQYYSSVCQSCLTRHPDISLYSFIYQEVGSGSP